MALAHRYVAIYPNGAADPNGAASQGDPGTNYSASYTTMALMEAGENGDLSAGDGTVLHVEIIPSDGSWNAAPDMTNVVFDGWTSDRVGDGSYVEVKSYGTARSSTGLYDTAAYILSVDDSAATLNLDNDFSVGDFLDIEFDGVQFRHHTTSGVCVQACLASSRHKDTRFLKCYMLQDTATYNVLDQLSAGTDFTLRIKNSIVEGGTDGIRIAGACIAAYIYNCTIFGTTADAIETDNLANIYPVNCAVFNNADDFQDAFPAGYPKYCACDDAESGANNCVDISPGPGTELEDWHLAFTDPDGSPPDVTVKAGSCLIDVGLDRTTDSEVPSDDIIGTARPDGSEDIGAFEYAAGGQTYELSASISGASATGSPDMNVLRAVLASITAGSAVPDTVLLKLLKALDASIVPLSSDFLGLIYWTFTLCLWEVNYYLKRKSSL